MDTIKIDKTKLLEKIKANRTAHRKIFEEAMEGYREEAIKQLDAMIRDAKAGRKIRRALDLVEPMDQTKDYDRVILMLEMGVEDAVDLDERQYPGRVTE